MESSFNSPTETKILQSAYSSWLNDILHEPKKRKKYALRKLPRAKRKSAQEFITEYNNQERPISVTSSVPTNSSNQTKEKRFEALVQQASFSSNKYKTRKGVLPGTSFYKWLNITSNPARLPPTFVIESNGQEVVYLWIEYIQEKGTTYRVFRSIEQLKRKLKYIINRLSRQTRAGTPIAVTKSPEKRLTLLESSEAVVQEIDRMLQNPQPLQMIQKYIVCKGANAWIARAVYKRRGNPMAWILTTQNQHMVQLLETPKASSVVASMTTNSWTQPKNEVELLAKAVENNHDMIFDELVGDYLQDAEGTWYLLQVKAFILRVYPKITNLLAHKKAGAVMIPSMSQLKVKLNGTVSCPGKFCHLDFEDDVLKDTTTFMSYKDMLQCHFTAQYALQTEVAMSYDSYKSGLQNYFCNLSRKEKNKYYNRISVCANCSREYGRLRQEAKDIQAKEEHPEEYREQSINDTHILADQQKEPTSLVEKNKPSAVPEIKDATSFRKQNMDSHLDELEALLGSNALDSSSDDEDFDDGSDEEAPNTKEDLRSEDLGHLSPTNPVEIDNNPFAVFNLVEDSVVDKINDSDTTTDNASTQLCFVPEQLDHEVIKAASVSPPVIDQLSLLEVSKPAATPVKKVDIFEESNTTWEPRNCVSEIWERSVPKEVVAPEKVVEPKNDNKFESHLPLYILKIEKCQSIFFDELYKEKILQEARHAFSLANRVQFAIPSSTGADYSSQQMVLRTLHIELRDECLEGEYVLPTIKQDEDSNTTMILVPLIK